jgi:hypothetical protein
VKPPAAWARKSDLGKPLVRDLVFEVVPSDIDEVRRIFSRKGAYARRSQDRHHVRMGQIVLIQQVRDEIRCVRRTARPFVLLVGRDQMRLRLQPGNVARLVRLRQPINEGAGAGEFRGVPEISNGTRLELPDANSPRLVSGFNSGNANERATAKSHSRLQCGARIRDASQGIDALLLSLTEVA